MAKNLQKLRNIGVCAHIDAGKTTVSERILFFAGRTYKIGEVHQGTAVMDFLPEEQERGIPITSAATTLQWRDCDINLIDTPGHVDFTVEVERSLRVLDGAIAVFCAVGGVEAQSETVWRQASKYKVSRLCFINKMDRAGADFEKVVGEIAGRLHGNPILMQLPMGYGDKFVGQIDLVRRKAWFYDAADVATNLREEEIPEEYREAVEKARHDMIEKAAEFDEALLEKYLHDQPINEADIVAAVRCGTVAGKLHPVFCGSALKHRGVRPLLDVQAVTGHEGVKSEDRVERKPDTEAPFCGLVFKITSDQHGDLSFLRVYSGTLKSGTRVLNSTQNKKEIVSRIWEMHANERIRRDVAVTGDIVAVVGLKASLTGDTLCDPHQPIVLEKPEFPDPVITMSIEPESNADKQKLGASLDTLRREDPTFRYRYDEETGQTTISGMGELHLEIIKNKLTRDMGVNVRVGRPTVAYKETIAGSATVEARFVRQTGGHGQFAVVELSVEHFVPAEKGDESVVFEDATKGGSVPKEYIASVEKGVRDAAGAGPLAGYPVLNVLVKLLDGKDHPVDSSDMAFQQAGSMAFNQAISAAKPVFLEPIMLLEVAVPEEYFGIVTGDLNSRRAEIRGSSQQGPYRVISATVPLAEMFGYSTKLRSLTQGRGTATMEPHAYGRTPASVTEKILKKP
ncbi:MAG: elongation factor G [Planctomycetota bacterium]|nr:elongation factor G [Planctomycetota bacterium]